MEFATLPITQMILNDNYPPKFCREPPVTQDAAGVCRALRSRRYKFASGAVKSNTVVWCATGQQQDNT